MTGPRILLYDIENSPELGYYWPPGYDTNILSVVDDWYMLSYAYTWYDPDGLDPDAIKFERKIQRKGDDKSLMRSLWKLWDEADAVMGHNGDAFDQKKSRTRMSYHDMPPPSPFIEVDTLKMARLPFKHSSNKLDSLARYYGIGEKLPHQGMATWFGCMNNDAESWATMEKYNKHDVVLMDGLYRRIAPWSRTKLNMQAWTGTHSCTNCGSRMLMSRGYQSRGGTERTHHNWRCLDCGQWSYELLSNEGKMRQV